MLKRNTFSGGSNGTTITTGNSGGTSGDAFSATSGSPKFTSVNATGARAPLVGLLSSTTSDILRWDMAPSGREIWVEQYIRLTQWPTNSSGFVNIYPNSQPTDNAHVYVETNGAIRISDNANTTVGTTSAVLVPDAWARWELYLNVGTNSSTGSFELRLFLDPEGTSPDDVISGSNRNFLGVAPDRITLSCLASLGSYYLDNVAVGDTGWMGPQWVHPTGLTATPASAHQIDLAWDSVSSASGYDVQRQRWSGSSWTDEQTTRVTTTTYSDTGLAESTEYRYRVRSAK